MKNKSTLNRKRDSVLDPYSEQTAPLEKAIILHHWGAVETLLIGNADPDGVVCRGVGSEYLADAVAEENLDVVRLLLNHGANPNAQGLEVKGCPVYFAACYGFQPILSALIQAGGNVNTVGDYQTTPLHAAAEAGHIDCMKLLLVKGANRNAEDCNGQTPLMCIVNSFTVSDKACSAVNCLLEAGADINKQDRTGATALMLAIEEGVGDALSLDLIQTLALGSDLTLTDQRGRSVWEYSKVSKSSKIRDFMAGLKEANDCLLELRTIMKKSAKAFRPSNGI